MSKGKFDPYFRCNFSQRGVGKARVHLTSETRSKRPKCEDSGANELQIDSHHCGTSALVSLRVQSCDTFFPFLVVGLPLWTVLASVWLAERNLVFMALTTKPPRCPMSHVGLQITTNDLGFEDISHPCHQTLAPLQSVLVTRSWM
jgi:hypothetical protein